MMQPADRDIARRVRDRTSLQGVDHALIAAAAGITVRQLRRRFEYEVPFRAGELAGIATALGCTVSFLLADPDGIAA